MQRAGAAERDQRELTRIVTSLDRDHADRTEHLRIDRLDHVRGLDADEWPRSRVGVQLEATRQRRWKAAEQKVGVGDRRRRPAAAVTRRTGIGARALRPDPERA